MKPINIGLLGVGTVGGGTFEVLKRNKGEIARRAGREIVVKMIADRELDKARALAGNDVTVTGDGYEVVNHPDIDIVVELLTYHSSHYLNNLDCRISYSIHRLVL